MLFAPLPSSAPRVFEYSGPLPLTPKGKGASVILGGPASLPTLTDPAEPNVPGAFAVGFDTHNPPTREPFGPLGNINGRPEREISLHWNGVEVDNRFCDPELIASPVPTVKIRAEEVVGGLNVTIAVSGKSIYEDVFVPFGRLPSSRVRWVGAPVTRPGVFRGTSQPIQADERPLIVKGLNDSGHHRVTQRQNLPLVTKPYGRVIASLTLGPTARGIDPWDRTASLTFRGRDGRTFEVLRCITPYRKAWTWYADVTHLMPILSGPGQAEWWCETWGEGWTVDATLTYVKGPLDVRPVRVEPLWQGWWVIGQATTPPLPFQVRPLGESARAKVFTTVTGHGQSPNSDNAAEFMPLDRTLRVGDQAWTNRLWKDDVYLNPCRPQGGTWKYSRAGWAPGSVPSPWAVDVTDALKSSGEIRYEIAPYRNKTPDSGNPARHFIESVLVRYR